MEYLLIFLTALLVGFSGAVVPGPLLSVTVSETLKRGVEAGPLLITGHALLEVGITVGLVYGLSHYLQSSLVGGIFGLLGGVTLLWMGWGMIKDVWSGKGQLNLESNDQGKSLNPVLAGALVSLSNPYFLIWWGTIGAGYVVIAMQYGLVGIIFFFFGHISADYIWYTFASWLVYAGSSRISSRAYRGITGGCGVFLVGMALFFLYSGFNFLFPGMLI
ncbi:MAG: lysine transporter LysE [Candidatus Syntrophonatronum acetioxidans]|uniref:Lysine transporter LysE n=1 Tax=Candidatus Syntrophonatronum acetioxidans TaxID=1795816 RepID=A0A424YDR3_9FIRM|nr:MAG: lysine transporter LysE [Candidatus Syntrophonatronum acetioxidans]